MYLDKSDDVSNRNIIVISTVIARDGINIMKSTVMKVNVNND